MGLKIIIPIGTDKGITSEAYVRITNYAISKGGYAEFKTELYQKQEDSIPAANTLYPTPMQTASRNMEIGDSFIIPLMKTITGTVSEPRMVNKEVDVIETVDGVEITTRQHTIVEEIVEIPFSREVPDLSPLEGIGIFEFAYSKLKEKLGVAFGVLNVIDC